MCSYTRRTTRRPCYIRVFVRMRMRSAQPVLTHGDGARVELNYLGAFDRYQLPEHNTRSSISFRGRGVNDQRLTVNPPGRRKITGYPGSLALREIFAWANPPAVPRTDSVKLRVFYIVQHDSPFAHRSSPDSPLSIRVYIIGHGLYAANNFPYGRWS